MTAPEVIEQLKKLRGLASLKLELGDGTTRNVPVPKAGNRWSKVTKVLEALSWVSLEALDAKAGVLGVLESDDDDDDQEDDELAGGGQLVKLARVMLEVQRGTMKEIRQMFDGQIKGMADLCGAMSDGIRTMNESYQTAMRVQAAAITARASGGEEAGGDEVMKMMQMAMLLNQRGAQPRVTPPAKED